jgi:hypothetical protein
MGLVSECIATNPLRWADDEYNPANIGTTDHPP